MTTPLQEGFPWLDGAPHEDMRRAVGALYRVHSLLGAIMDPDALLVRISEESRTVASAEAASVMLYDGETDELYFQVALGDSGDQDALKREVRLKMGQGIAGLAAQTRRAVSVPDVTKDPRFFSDADAASQFQTRSLLAVPMMDRDRLIGVLEVVNKVGGDAFSEMDEHVMAMFSSVAATAVVNARLIGQQIRNERLAAIGEAIASLTHHIKNIITGLGSSTELIQMALDRGNAEMALRTWPVLKRNVARMSCFVQDMLAFAKPRVPVRRPADLSALVRDAAQSVKDALAARSAVLELDLERVSAPVSVDEDGIFRCLLNLLQNAVEALPETGGRVCVAASITPCGALEILVADNGAGVPPEIRKNLFQPFFSTKGGRGTGLGLATSEKIVKEHGGSLVLAPSASGACFRMLVPGAAVKNEDRE